MADQTVTIKISAKDDASSAFKKIQEEMAKTGKSSEATASSLRNLVTHMYHISEGTIKAGAGLSVMREGFGGLIAGMVTLDKGLINIREGFKGLHGVAMLGGAALGAMSAGAVGIAGSLFEMAKKAAESGEQLEILSKRTGISVENLSTLRGVMVKGGGTIDDLTLGIRTLSKQVEASLDPTSKQAALFKVMGINVKAAHGDMMNLLLQVADGMKKFKDPIERTAAGYELLGRGAKALIPAMSQGSEEIKRQQAEMKGLGLELTTAGAILGHEFSDKMKIMGEQLNTIAVKIGEQLIPHLIVFVDLIQHKLADPKVQEGIGKLGVLFEDLGKGIAFALSHLQDVATLIGALSGGAAGAMIGGPLGALIGAGLGATAGAVGSTYMGAGSPVPGMAGRRNNFPYPGTESKTGGAAGVDEEATAEAVSARQEAAKLAAENAKALLKAQQELKEKLRADTFFKGTKNDTGLGFALRMPGTFGIGTGLASSQHIAGNAYAGTPGATMVSPMFLAQRAAGMPTGEHGLSGLADSQQAKQLQTLWIQAWTSKSLAVSAPPSEAIVQWRKFSDALQNLFRGTGGVFPSISAGFKEFVAQSGTLADTIKKATVSTLSNLQTGLSGAYNNLIFGGSDEKGRKRTIDALKDIRTEASNVVSGIFHGKPGELSVAEGNRIDALFGLTDQPGLPETTKQKINQLKVQMLGITTEGQRTAFLDSVNDIIGQLDSQDSFLGRIKQFGDTIASNIAASLKTGLSDALAKATIDMVDSFIGGMVGQSTTKAKVDEAGKTIGQGVGSSIHAELKSAGGDIADAITSGLKLAWDKSAGVMDAFGSFIGWMGKVTTGALQIGNSLAGDITKGLQAVWNQAGGVMDAFGSFIGWMGKVTTGAGDIGKSLASSIKDGLKWAWDNKSGLLDAAFSFISWMGGVAGNGLDMGKAVAGSIKDGLKWAWDNKKDIEDAAISAGKWIGDIFGGINLKDAKGFAGSIVGLGSSIVDLFKDGGDAAKGISGNLGLAVKNGFMAAGIAALFAPGSELAAGIGSALGTLVGAAFGSAQVGGAIGGVIGAAVDKIFFGGEKAKAAGAYKDFMVDVQAFGGVRQAFSKAGGLGGLSGSATYKGIFGGGDQRDQLVDLFRQQGGISKETASGAYDAIAAYLGGRKASVAASTMSAVRDFLTSIGLYSPAIESAMDPYATEGASGESGGTVAAPAAAQSDLDKAIAILQGALAARGLSKSKVLSSNWSIMSQAINAAGGIFPSLGVSIKDIYRDSVTPSDMQAFAQSGIPLTARYGLGRVPGAEGQPVPAIVHGGEQILSAPQVRAGMGSGDTHFNTTIVVQDTGGGAQSAKQQANTIWQELQPKFEDFIRRKSRWGQLPFSDRSLRTVLQ